MRPNIVCVENNSILNNLILIIAYFGTGGSRIQIPICMKSEIKKLLRQQMWQIYLSNLYPFVSLESRYFCKGFLVALASRCISELWPYFPFGIN